jgi:prepilin-type N-terminal cleavage/methylation domain-containing protein
MNERKRAGLTLVELIVVMAIMAILLTIAVNVYITRVTLAKVAAARATIDQLEVAVAIYQVDVGEIPPSYSGTALPPSAPDNTSLPYDEGCGYLFTALTRSLSGDMLNPLTLLWRGPYIDIPSEKLGDISGTPLSMYDDTSGLASPEKQILDPWGNPYTYIRHQDYDTLGGTEVPDAASRTVAETYYNANGFQIVSRGPNGETFDPPNRGNDLDDVTNFKNYEIIPTAVSTATP